MRCVHCVAAGILGRISPPWSESTLGANMAGPAGCASSSCLEVAKYFPRLQDTVVHSPPALAKVVAPSCKKEGRLWRIGRRVRCERRQRGGEPLLLSFCLRRLLLLSLSQHCNILTCCCCCWLHRSADSTWCNFYPSYNLILFLLDHPSQFIQTRTMGVLVEEMIVHHKIRT